MRIQNKEAVQKVGQKVTLAGWVHTRRDHGKIIFIDLRDKTGLIQVVFLNKPAELYQTASSLRSEYVIEVEGMVNQRPANMVNDKMVTGTVEVLAEKLTIINQAETLPFEIDGDGYEIKEDLRLKYRYLDLRRERMLRNLTLIQETKRFIV